MNHTKNISPPVIQETVKHHMASEKMKEIREWINLAMTAFTVIAIPVGVILLKNQRLELKEEISRNYMSRVSFDEYTKQHQVLSDKEILRIDNAVTAQKIHTEKVETKLDSLGSKVDAIFINLTTLQAELRMLNNSRVIPAAPK